MIVALGLAALSTADSATPYPWYASATVVLAAGCPTNAFGVGSGLQGITRELGSALAGTVLTGAVVVTTRVSGAGS